METDPTKPIGDIQKDSMKSHDMQIEIGNSLYTFSEEAQRFIYPIKLADFDKLWLGLPTGESRYPDFLKKKSVLIVSDPHWLSTAQFRLYKGLEVFFRDNPGLVGKTAFLAEGFPAGQPISLQSLRDVEPNPNDQLVRKVLESYLIPGYVAYEWKHHQGIPVIGIEDQPLYEISRDYALIRIKDPEKILFSGSARELDEIIKRYNPDLWQKLQGGLKISSLRGKTIPIVTGISVTLTDELRWNTTYGAIQSFVAFARDYRMAQTAINESLRFENPMLFIGHRHLYDFDIGGDVWIFEFLKLLIDKSGPQGPLGSDVWSICKNTDKIGIYQYLKNEKIGFTFLDPEKLGDKEGPDDEANYHKLHQTQQEAGQYGGYVNGLIQQKGLRKETTVRPSPETAAD